MSILESFWSFLSGAWDDLTATPSSARQMHWAAFCLAALLASWAALGVLESSHGQSSAAAHISRILAGPAHWFYQNVYSWPEGLSWEVLMLYSAGLWIGLYLVGIAVVRLAMRVPISFLAVAVLLTFAAVGYLCARPPEDPMQRATELYYFMERAPGP